MSLRLTIGFGMLDAVYVETKELKQVVAIHPKPVFGPILKVATAWGGFSKGADKRVSPGCLWAWGDRSVFLVETREGGTIPDPWFGWLSSARLAGDDIQVAGRLLSHALALTPH